RSARHRNKTKRHRGTSLPPVAFHSLPSSTPITRSNRPKPWAKSGPVGSAPKPDQWSQLSAALGTAHTPDSSPGRSKSGSPSHNSPDSSTSSSRSGNRGRSRANNAWRGTGKPDRRSAEQRDSDEGSQHEWAVRKKPKPRAK